MRPAPSAFTCDIGDNPRVVQMGPTVTVVRTRDALITFEGTLEQRRALAIEMARELGLSVALPGVERLLAEMQR